MNEEELTCKLQRLGLILNRPEPALTCQQCKYAFQPIGKKVSTHLAEKHALPASERKELVSYIDSLHLPDPNLLSVRRNGSEPHPHLLVSRGAAYKYCNYPLKELLAYTAAHQARTLENGPQPALGPGRRCLTREHAELDTH